jgi:pimeloyl-ACP methyl ester carboxylesterase
VTAASARTRVVVRVDGQRVPVTVVLPDRYRSGQHAPLLLALPPGGQGKAEVDALLDRYWAPDAQRRGWVVVSPEAPPTGLYFAGESARLLPDLVDAVERWYPPEGGRVHVAGVSNGGLSAWRYALDHPEAVRSLLTAPGFPPEPADEAHVATLAGVPVLLVVGGEDTGWREAMETTRDDLRAAGGQVRLIVSPGEGHIMEKVAPSTLWAFLERARRG